MGTPFAKYTETKVEKNWVDAFVGHRFKVTEENYVPYGKIPLPKLRFTEEEQKKLTALGSDLDKYVTDSEPAFIIGKDLTWDKYVQTIKEMGIDEYVKIYQTAYDRWKNTK